MRAYAIRITKQGWSHSGMLMETSGRVVGGDVRAFQKQGHKNLFLICQFAVCLPGTNAHVERIFSIINNKNTQAHRHDSDQLSYNLAKQSLH